MKNFLFRAAVHCLVILVGSIDVTTVNAFVSSPRLPLFSLQPTSSHGYIDGVASFGSSYRSKGTAILFSSTSTRPLYDGTNFTFPDTRTPTGFAELLEVSFVHACMQLASGYVDVLKMFIAASIGAYEAGFSIDSLLEELECNKEIPNTANRPLMDEEKKLRRDWLCVVYLTLAAIGFKPSIASELAVETAKKSIPEDIQKRYGELVTEVAEAHKNMSLGSISLEDLTSRVGGNAGLSPLEKAVVLQSLKVATLTPVVVEEAKEAQGSTDKNQKKEIKVPTPPIEGAF